MNLHHRPLFLFTAAYVLGIICAASLQKIRPEVFLLTAVAAVIASGILLGLCRTGCAKLDAADDRLSSPVKSRPCYLSNSLRLIVILGVGVFLIGYLRAVLDLRVARDDISKFADDKQAYVTGYVASDTDGSGRGVSFVMRVRSVKTYAGLSQASGRAFVSLYTPQSSGDSSRVPQYGELITVHGRLESPRPPSNPGAIDYREYLARKGIHCAVYGPSSGVKYMSPASVSVTGLASDIKSGMSARARSLFAPLHAKLLIGIIMGGYADLPMEVQSAFMRSGTMHLLAASGYNCGVVLAIFGFLLYRFTTPRNWRHLILILVLWAFTIIAGAGPSMVRASVMATIFLSAYLLKRASDMVNAILLACLVILGISPLYLYDVGFQLSFAAVFSIVLMMPLMDEYTGKWFVAQRGTDVGRAARCVLWTARTVVSAIWISAAAGFGTLPIAVYYFNYISTVGILANALTALFVVALTVFGIGALVVGCSIPGIGQLVSTPAALCMKLMLKIVAGLADFPYAVLSVPTPPLWIIFSYYVILLGALEYAYRRPSKTQNNRVSP